MRGKEEDRCGCCPERQESRSEGCGQALHRSGNCGSHEPEDAGPTDSRLFSRAGGEAASELVTHPRSRGRNSWSHFRFGLPCVLFSYLDDISHILYVVSTPPGVQRIFLGLRNF